MASMQRAPAARAMHLHKPCDDLDSNVPHAPYRLGPGVVPATYNQPLRPSVTFRASRDLMVVHVRMCHHSDGERRATGPGGDFGPSTDPDQADVRKKRGV